MEQCFRGVLAVHQRKQKDGAKQIALANLAFHEFAHNKYDGTGNDVHVDGGGGLLGKPVMPAAISGSIPNPDNRDVHGFYLESARAAVHVWTLQQSAWVLARCTENIKQLEPTTSLVSKIQAPQNHIR